MVAIGKLDGSAGPEGDRQGFAQEDGKLLVEGDQNAAFRAHHAHGSPNMCSDSYAGCGKVGASLDQLQPDKP